MMYVREYQAAHVISIFYKEVMFGIMKQVNQTNVQSKLLNHCFILVLEILLLFQKSNEQTKFYHTTDLTNTIHLEINLSFYNICSLLATIIFGDIN